MKKIFWEDPYLTQLQTKVKEVRENKILPEETIIFSFSGGQESDKATMNRLPVLNSEKMGNLIYYTLPADHPFKIGDAIEMQIDWPRRYRLMRLHFAAELVLELVTRKAGLEKIGAHIAQDKARIDFLYDQNISTLFPEILADYNQIICSDLPIQTGYLDEISQRRYWRIDGFTQVPCGGTHVKSTKEVGYVTLKRQNIGRSKERIEIRLMEPDGGS